ncbi:MAG: multicopper oxidase domain-containing protein [Sphingomonas bacterium]|nr:multicopper oxidase domain-containing protein [Sphingomonas bacterium]
MAFGDENSVVSDEEITFSTFGCSVRKGDPPTPDRLTPDVVFQRRGAENADLVAPDGKKIKFWGFVDSALPLRQQKVVYPSPTIRVTKGQVVHTILTTAKGAHTIHHHGIEPTTANDGVGHVSFEVGEKYAYQWQPHHAGTFFYHCHVNTVLHFQLGMFGMLIVDPPKTADGLKRLHEKSPTFDPVYDVEKFWVATDMDPRWHEITDHDAGLCGMDVGLNRYEPKYFLLTGVFNNRTMTDARTMITARVGQRILVRLCNASYSILRVTLDCDAIWASCDGHGLGLEPWCDPVVIPAGTPFDVSPAQRYDLILTPPRAGTYSARMEFRHWITGKIQNNGSGVVQTKVAVS